LIDHHETIVVALGGNAITAPNEEGNIEQQFDHTRQTVKQIADLIEAGYETLITHGNGPQVGSILRRAEIASDELYPIPLEVCVADTQAGMGYMIAQLLHNELVDRSIAREVVTLVTNVIVDADDPAFDHPNKPIGPRLSAATAKRHEQEDNWKIMEVSPGAYRRIVPSPMPHAICELATIRLLCDSDKTIVCCGGGGIPITEEHGKQSGVAAVVDKDRTTVLLALGLGIKTIILATAVEHVCLNFAQDDEVALDVLTATEAAEHLRAGQFGEGSMGPKIEAAIDFVNGSEHEDAVAIIAHIDKLKEAMAGTSGTRIVKARMSREDAKT
jgi:carbamate kinase